MEEKLAEIGEPDFLVIRVFMTRGWTQDDAAKIILQDDDKGDTIIRDGSGRALRQKMNFGRPQWDREFQTMNTTHQGSGNVTIIVWYSHNDFRSNVGVFFCGPKVLSSEIHVMCNKYTDATSQRGTKFFYNKVGWVFVLNRIILMVAIRRISKHPRNCGAAGTGPQAHSLDVQYTRMTITHLPFFPFFFLLFAPCGDSLSIVGAWASSIAS